MMGTDATFKRIALLVMLGLAALVAACGAGGSPTPPDDVQATLPPQPSLTPTPLPSPSAPPPPPTATPASTATPEPASWYGADAVALIVAGEDDEADLLALDRAGETRLVPAGVGREVRVAPDGRWLGFVRWGGDGRATLELHDAANGARQAITPDTTSGLLRFAFDPAGRRLAYVDLGAPGTDGVPWALVVVDLETEAVARYDAFMPHDEPQLLPGSPVGWSGAVPGELIVDTFLPYTEGGWKGVWGVTLPPDGASAPLETLPRRQLVPGAPAYTSPLYLAPDRQSLAFLGRDPDYVPADYAPEFFDLAVNRLALVALDDGARDLLVEVTDGSALAGSLAWSPDGERLLYAQGRYDGESFASLTLQSVDRGGAVVAYGPLTLPPLGGLLELAWCQDGTALYTTWDGSAGTQRLFRFDLAAGASTELSAAGRVEIVGCRP